MKKIKINFSSSQNNNKMESLIININPGSSSWTPLYHNPQYIDLYLLTQRAPIGEFLFTSFVRYAGNKKDSKLSVWTVWRKDPGTRPSSHVRIKRTSALLSCRLFSCDGYTHSRKGFIFSLSLHFSCPRLRMKVIWAKRWAGRHCF